MFDHLRCKAMSASLFLLGFDVLLDVLVESYQYLKVSSAPRVHKPFLSFAILRTLCSCLTRIAFAFYFSTFHTVVSPEPWLVINYFSDYLQVRSVTWLSPYIFWTILSSKWFQIKILGSLEPPPTARVPTFQGHH